MTIIGVKSWWYQPLFVADKATRGDIAIVTLAQDVPMELFKDGRVNYACLPFPNATVASKFISHGWGKMLKSARSFINTVYTVPYMIINGRSWYIGKFPELLLTQQ